MNTFAQFTINDRQLWINRSAITAVLENKKNATTFIYVGSNDDPFEVEGSIEDVIAIIEAQ